jgi:hypothetical protein
MGGEVEDSTHIDELMYIFDVDLVATNAANEVHEAKLRVVRKNQSDKVRLPNRCNDAIISKLLSLGKSSHAQ